MTKIHVIIFLLIIIISISFVYSQTTRRKGYNKFKTAEMEVNIHITPSTTQLRSVSFQKEEKSDLGIMGGLDLGSYFANYSNYVLGFSIGANYSKYNTLRNSVFKDTLKTVGFDNEDILVFESATLTEKQNVTFIEVPILFRAKMETKGKLSYFLNIGPSLSLPITKTYQISGPYTRHNYLIDINGLITQDIIVEGSKFYNTNELPITTTGKMDIGYAISLVSNLGARYQINARYQIFGGLNVVYGFKNINNTPSNKSFELSSGFKSLNSLSGRSDKITNFAYGFQFGMCVVLGKKAVAKKGSTPTKSTNSSSSQKK